MTKFNNIVGLALILGLLHACGSKPNPEKEEAYQKAAEKFVADESFFPILDEELFYFNSQRVDTIGVDYMNEQEAVEKLLKQETWLAFTTRDYTAKEKKSLQDHKFVVFDNPLSSTVRWCVDSILGGKEFTNPNIGAVKTSAAVIDYVEKHENSLGIIGSNWLNDKRDTTNVTFKKNITVMGVSKLDSATKANSWKPYQFYLYNGNYPLRRTIYALLNDTRNGTPTAFAHFCQLPKGQLIILRSGLLPQTANMNVRQIIVNKE